MPVTFAIVGRPNVGKSTLFNRLVGRQHAIVDNQPGVTRDRREGQGYLATLAFTVIDTAGLEEADEGSLQAQMRRQTEMAIRDADITLMVVDAKGGVTPVDKFFASEIRKLGARVVLLANKCEGKAGAAGLSEAWTLGLGEPVPISAAHGEGLVDLHDAMLEAAQAIGLGDVLTGDDDNDADDHLFTDSNGLDEKLDADGNLVDVWQDEQVSQPMRIAIVGRPNMGKSTLINSLIDEDRLLTGPEAGITRDSIEVPFQWHGKPYKLVDTAGMRRRARIADKVEKLMVDDALRAVQYAHLCVLLIDATEEIHKQDLSIACLIEDEGRAIVIGANKWDAVRDKQAASGQISDRLQTSLAQLRGVPVVQMSGLRKKGLSKLLDAADEMYGIWNTRISTGRLNRWLDTMLEAHPPPLVEGRRLRIRYMTQIKTRPPTFALFVSRPTDLPESYLRYLTSGLRSDFGLRGVPIRMVMRKRENPFAPS
ncbi:ribosome biogenesis GTPase Der [Candidatus Puniceispirillum sp.]|jgi:GTPase|nr:ribosome biogenesis GTPase Der [Alphaproteobacteria bacterium]MDC1293608.1 ribosome biogenesis GTPase Der [Candidatus Puniceispirillum sp.]